MKRLKWVLLTVFLLVAGWSGRSALANQLVTSDFIAYVSVKNKSGAAAAKLALQNSNSVHVRIYAQRMLDEYLTEQIRLALLAQQKGVALEDELQHKAYVFIRKGETFDTAYASKRVAELKRVVQLTRKAMFSQDAEVRRYAEQTLPVLMQHWYQAQQLVLALNNPTQPAGTIVASR